jgi:hypothetical protein
MKYLSIVLLAILLIASCKKVDETEEPNPIIGKYSIVHTVSYGGPYCNDPTEYSYDTLSVTAGNQVKFLNTDYNLDEDGNIVGSNAWDGGWFRNDSLYVYHLNHSLACNILYAYTGYKISNIP